MVIDNRLLVYLLFFVVYCVYGIMHTSVLELQEKGCTYAQQSRFTIVLYPFLFKMVLAPILDLYYIKKIGKCKTWVCGSSFLLGITAFVLAPHMESLISPDRLNTLIFAIFTWFLMDVFLQIATEIWIIKMFNRENKARASFIMSLGMCTGIATSYNLFIPLNSVSWLNDHFYSNNPRKEPLLTHQALFVGIGILSLALGAIVLFLITEDKVEDKHERMTLGALFKILPRFFIVKTVRKHLIALALMRFVPNFLMESILLKIMDGGIKKTTIVSIETSILPIYIVILILGMRLINTQTLGKTYYKLLILQSLAILFKFSSALIAHSSWRAPSPLVLVFLTLGLALDKLLFVQTVCFAFINTVANQRISSTYLTLFISWMNMGEVLPNSLGLVVTGWAGQSWAYVWGLAVLLHISLLLFYRVYWVEELDSLTKAQFNVLEETEGDIDNYREMEEGNKEETEKQATAFQNK